MKIEEEFVNERGILELFTYFKSVKKCFYFTKMCFYFAKLCFFSWKITVRGLHTSNPECAYSRTCFEGPLKFTMESSCKLQMGLQRSGEKECKS